TPPHGPRGPLDGPRERRGPRRAARPRARPRVGLGADERPAHRRRRGPRGRRLRPGRQPRRRPRARAALLRAHPRLRGPPRGPRGLRRQAPTALSRSLRDFTDQQALPARSAAAPGAPGNAPATFTALPANDGARIGYNRGEMSQAELWKSELLVSEAVGRLMEFWGFKRNMGRVWTVLYLSVDPLSAGD